MKSDLQIRAERAAEQFASAARKPVVIEFAGVPKAGKTTALNHIQTFLKRCGFRTEIVVERASVCPIRDKKHANFNVWTACTTLAQILEKTQDPPRLDDPHVLILDRGLFDAICWMRMLERLARIRRADRDLVERFLRTDDWRKRISSVIVMTASPEDALQREKGHLPVEDVNGSIMNEEVLQQVLEMTKSCVEELKKDFRIHTIDTSFGETRDDPKRTAEVVADIVLSLIEEQLQEEVLVLAKSKIAELFNNRLCLPAEDAAVLTKMFIENGEFRPRDQAEEDRELIQALPLVIVRNASGEVLRLRRKERSTDNPLHQTIAIWAGGHVRKEDATNGDALIQCAMRELVEELRLNVEPKELRLIGAVYVDTGGSTSKHVGIAFEWKAKTDDVAVALSSAEFFERRGTSLSGSFVSLEKLSCAVDSKKNIEPWSAELVRECLAKDSFDFSPRLL
jgi:predicted NUDIX family phosphoesterase/predicted ATPase